MLRGLNAVRTVLLEYIVTGAASSAVPVFKDPLVINWKVTSRPIPIDTNTVGVSPRSTTKVMTGTGTSAPLILIRSQEIGSPRGSIVPQKVRNAHPFKISINQFSPEHGQPTPIFSKVPPTKVPTPTLAVGWTSGVIRSSPKVQTLWILGYCPPTHQIKSSPSSSPLPYLKG